jgi:hypothetical protein
MIMSLSNAAPLFKQETPRQKLKRCLRECEEYLGQIGETESADTMEAASAALWDVIMSAPTYRSPNPRALGPLTTGMISDELAAMLDRGDYRKAGE